ncbi:MAG TPA: hypothetical protein PLA11_15305, partial [Flavobacteriales bacterium]|nr:hypothetical protein [Flavobacteriales bacterium]
MRAFLIAIVLLLLPPIGAGTRPPAPLANYLFGLSLATGHNGQLFSCFMVKVFEDKVIGSDPITREQFLMQARGLEPSKANADGTDLFARFDVRRCAVLVYEEGHQHM